MVDEQYSDCKGWQQCTQPERKVSMTMKVAKNSKANMILRIAPLPSRTVVGLLIK